MPRYEVHIEVVKDEMGGYVAENAADLEQLAWDGFDDYMEKYSSDYNVHYYGAVDGEDD